MFKSKEDVITEIKIKNSKMQCGYTVEIGVGEAFKSIDERIDYYREWKDQPFSYGEKFGINSANHPEILWTNHHNYDNDSARCNDFNDWLFNFCFDGVK